MNKHKYFKALIYKADPCAAGTVGFEEKTDDELLSKYVRHAAFVSEHGVPNNGQLLQNFTGEQLLEKQIYVTEPLEKRNPHDRHILGGDHLHNIEFDKFNVGDLYIKDDAWVSITARVESHRRSK